MIIFDTETTGLIANTLLPLKLQPRIVEFFAFKLDDETLETVGEIEQLLDPGQPLDEDVQRITGLKDADLRGKPSWASFQPRLADFFLGERIMVAHNCSYDRDVLSMELRRTDSLMKFPWPIDHRCTVEMTEHVKGHRMSLSDLHMHLFGETFPSAHRARHDVEALTRCYRELVKTGVAK